ncbi:MAG TPA: DUF308 domain-containing protein [Mucilaginibacter sp.]|nr:DUF308 domain-containing protein [Mucilaginibacter sp.]
MEITVDRSLRHWWVFVLRGIIFVLLGIYIFSSPVSAYLALSFMFGLVILLAGVSELLHSYQDKGSASRGWHLFVGLVDLILGLILVSHLAASMDVMRIIVGIYFLFRGLSVFNFRALARGSVWVVLGAFVVLVFAMLVLFNPTFGTVTIIVWTSSAFIVTGILNIMLGIRMKPVSGVN